MTPHPWYHLEDEADVASPALLLYMDRIRHNLNLMLKIAGGAERLRPHVKTHKLGELVRAQIALGITRFKASTIAESEMCASAGAADVLLAMPCVGPNAGRLAALAAKFPQAEFSTIADDEATIETVAAAARRGGHGLGIYLELDCGMGRTGITPGARALELARKMAATPGVTFRGLHAYDGHIHEASLEAREAACEAAYAPVLAFRAELERAGLQVRELVAGGSPTFGIHARYSDRICSPGTTVLWDFGYGDKHPDLPFLPAAVVMGRVISKPREGRITLDLGHKSMAPEQPQPRVRFEELPEMNVVMQSEEHLVLETPRAGEFAIGQALHGIPRHVCPTVSMHGEAVIVDGARVVDRCPIPARNRRITV